MSILDALHSCFFSQSARTRAQFTQLTETEGISFQITFMYQPMFEVEANLQNLGR